MRDIEKVDEVPVEGKDPKKSKTIFFGLFVALIPVVSAIWPKAGLFLSEYQEAIYAVIGVIIGLLRGVTGTKLDLKKAFKF